MPVIASTEFNKRVYHILFNYNRQVSNSILLRNVITKNSFSGINDFFFLNLERLKGVRKVFLETMIKYNVQWSTF